ncbi:MAG: hypothetical protein AAB973_02540 [Patescibacteria group bacterium]
MSKNNILIFLGIALVMVSAYLMYTSYWIDKPSSEKPRDLICQVTIENPLFFGSKITNIDCDSQPSGFFSFSLSDIYTDKGNLEMKVGSKSTSTTYKIVESETITKEMRINRLYPGVVSVSFNLKDNNKNIISSKTISQTI